jgi:hypothetical protein
MPSTSVPARSRRNRLICSRVDGSLTRSRLARPHLPQTDTLPAFGQTDTPTPTTPRRPTDLRCRRRLSIGCPAAPAGARVTPPANRSARTPPCKGKRPPACRHVRSRSNEHAGAGGERPGVRGKLSSRQRSLSSLDRPQSWRLHRRHSDGPSKSPSVPSATSAPERPAGLLHKQMGDGARGTKHCYRRSARSRHPSSVAVSAPARGWLCPGPVVWRQRARWC